MIQNTQSPLPMDEPNSQSENSLNDSLEKLKLSTDQFQSLHQQQLKSSLIYSSVSDEIKSVISKVDELSGMLDQECFRKVFLVFIVS